jgi:hypothetical protein
MLRTCHSDRQRVNIYGPCPSADLLMTDYGRNFLPLSENPTKTLAIISSGWDAAACDRIDSLNDKIDTKRGSPLTVAPRQVTSPNPQIPLMMKILCM